MDFQIQTLPAGGLPNAAADALLVVVVGSALPTGAQGLDKALEALLADAVAQGDFEFKANRCLYLHRPQGVRAARLAFVCAPDASAKAFRAALGAGLAALKALGVAKLAVARIGAAGVDGSHAEALATAVGEAVYVYRHTKPSAPAAPKLEAVTLLVAKKADAALAKGLARGLAVAAGVAVARECANRPGNHATPSHLASEAKAIGKRYGMKVDIFDRKDIEKIGMGSFLAVAQGSEEPPRFIVVKYEGAAKSVKPTVLVGKGITFDSGGISLKPGAEMDEMKFDMGGAASVLGTLTAIGELKAKVNLIGIIAACENMPSGRAVKPGDVVKSLSGQTIEILNTDAEGRLILCDALTYAERFEPAAVVDIATLTGACVVALGHHNSGLFSPDDGLAGELLAASKAALDPAWRMPLDEEYDEGLKSNFADMANIAGRAGGAVTAAMFLKRFTAKFPWAHLDIAGTGWKSGPAKGSTGRPVPLLTHFVLGRAK
ncbi:MAG TPA: leucyl aminopeptidase [Burkholderiaceae bacterium]|nr:leucyl aminopeptidase [Burkholderiaceae bacterium]